MPNSVVRLVTAAVTGLPQRLRDLRQRDLRLPRWSPALLLLLVLTGCNGFFIDGHTSTALTSSAVSALYGTSITLTATVSSTSATGTIVFYDGTTELGSETVSSGVATLTLTDLATGTHDMTAEYSGDTTYNESTSSELVVTVNQSLTSTITLLSSSATAVTAGTSVTLTATVSAAAATGTVAFYDGSTLLGTINLSSAAATYSTSTLAAGTHTLEAIYSGDGTYATSESSAVTVTVTAGTSKSFTSGSSVSSAEQPSPLWSHGLARPWEHTVS